MADNSDNIPFFLSIHYLKQFQIVLNNLVTLLESCRCNLVNLTAQVLKLKRCEMESTVFLVGYPTSPVCSRRHTHGFREGLFGCTHPRF